MSDFYGNPSVVEIYLDQLNNTVIPRAATSKNTQYYLRNFSLTMRSSFLLCLPPFVSMCLSSSSHLLLFPLTFVFSQTHKKTMCVYLFPLEGVSEMFQPETLQELVDGHVEQSCRETDVMSGGVSESSTNIYDTYAGKITPSPRFRT